MKQSAIALDYDGTIARNDVLDPSVRDAIAAARIQGTTVLLVTGRTVDDLRRVAGDLHFVDGVIAENGAVVHFPDRGRTSTLAPLVLVTFVDELRRPGISFRAGQCLVDADANEASYVRALVQTQQLPIPSRSRRRLLLGHTEEGREFSLAVRGRNVLVTGDAKAGKSAARSSISRPQRDNRSVPPDP